MNGQIHNEIHKLDHLFKVVAKINDEEIKAHLSKYLCVLTSGLIENSIRILLSDCAKKKSHPYIGNYVNKKIDRLTNLKHNNIIELLQLFSDSWSEKYRNDITDEQKAAIDSVIDNRHSIAHGRNIGLTFVTIQKYYKDTKAVIQILESIIKSIN
jgi:hypothetical protein